MVTTSCKAQTQPDLECSCHEKKSRFGDTVDCVDSTGRGTIDPPLPLVSLVGDVLDQYGKDLIVMRPTFEASGCKAGDHTYCLVGDPRAEAYSLSG